MTPEQIRAVVEQVIDSKLMPWWYVSVVTLIGWAVVAIVLTWAGTYLKTKAERFAKSEDLDKLASEVRQITRVAEKIKVELSGDLWLDQRRWDLKRELYVALLEGLDSLDYALVVMIGTFKDAEQAEAANDQNARQRFDKLYGSARKRAISALRSVRRARTIGRVFLSRDAQAALTTMAESWTSGLRSSSKGLIGAKADLAETLSQATEAIVQAAKADLFAFRPPPS